MPYRRRLVLALTGLALAFPGTALAQSAGDDQYSDPFGGSGGGGGNSNASPSPTPAAPSTPSTSAPSSPSTAPSTSSSTAPSAAAASATPVPAASGAAPVTTSRGQLPYTGADAGLLALAGMLSIGGGVALRVRLRG